MFELLMKSNLLLKDVLYMFSPICVWPTTHTRLLTLQITKHGRKCC